MYLKVLTDSLTMHKRMFLFLQAAISLHNFTIFSNFNFNTGTLRDLWVHSSFFFVLSLFTENLKNLQSALSAEARWYY